MRLCSCGKTLQNWFKILALLWCKTLNWYKCNQCVKICLQKLKCSCVAAFSDEYSLICSYHFTLCQIKYLPLYRWHKFFSTQKKHSFLCRKCENKAFVMNTYIVMNMNTVFTINWEGYFVVVIAAIRNFRYFLYIFIL